MRKTDDEAALAGAMRQRSFRLAVDTLERLERRARERGQSVNTLAARLIEEGLRGEDHPLIYFREGAAGRRPALLGSRVDVGQVIQTLRDHDHSVADTVEYLGQPEPKIRAAMRYYAEFRDEVDAWTQRMAEIARREEETFGRQQTGVA